MKVSLHIAESTLPELIEAALAGEDVVIDSGNHTAVRIVPVPKSKTFAFGLLEGKVATVPDFFEPMSEDDLAAWEGGR